MDQSARRTRSRAALPATLCGLVVILALTACQPGSSAAGPSTAASGAKAAGSSAAGSDPSAAAGSTAPAGSTTPASSGCSASGRTIPAGRYAGSIKATLKTTMHLNLPGANIPNAGGGTEAMHGSISIVSNGRTVTGTISLSGLGLSQVGMPGEVQVHSVDNGELSGRIGGSASAPTVSGTLSGEWASLDAPVVNGKGSASNGVRAGLHVTRAGCASISGDAIAMFADMAAPVAQYLSIGGSGTWTATRS